MIYFIFTFVLTNQNIFHILVFLEWKKYIQAIKILDKISSWCYLKRYKINSSFSFLGDPHSLIGISLILGFVFMLLVDQCSARRSGVRERSVTATLGLVVHAAADGVALGAAATTSQADVELIVFLAIMLHKVNKID